MAHAEIRVRLQPRARAEEIVGERGGALVVRVTAPALEGRANAALCTLIARRAGVARGAVEVVRGAHARDKVVRVQGVAEAQLRAALSGRR
jgi:hypothetical protein